MYELVRVRSPAGPFGMHDRVSRRGHTHCATQFFEGLFNFRFAPGESATHTFNDTGEFFFNDCFGPRPTGKVEVFHEQPAKTQNRGEKQ